MKDVVPFLVAFIFGVHALSIFSPNGNAQVETLRLEGSDLVVEVHKTHAHPFLGDYEFKLLLKVGADELDHVDMNADTGGRNRIDVVRTDSLTIAFRDHARAVCLNMASEKFEDCTTRALGKRIGFFDFDSNKNWRFVRLDGGRN